MNKINILELFSGTESFSKCASQRGYNIFTIDSDIKFNPTLCKDILEVNKNDIPFHPDIIWASPPCQCFSVASISKHWKGGHRSYIPSTTEALISIELIKKTVNLIDELNPTYYFIENPRGVLRKLNLIPYPRKTCCYCQYGDKRMKPTDIWTNLELWEPKMCKNGNPDHEPSPRGSKTGTQGLTNKIERARVPEILCDELLDIIEMEKDNK